MRRTKNTSQYSLTRISFLFAMVALLGAGISMAQAPPGCPHVCQGTYALCISATCDAQGNCGQGDSTGSGGGYCYIFEGQSCSYYQSCPEGGLYSTYSEKLLDTYGFVKQKCSSLPGNSDCMDKVCKRTGNSVQLKNVQTGEMDTIQTAICTCTSPVAGPGTFEVLNVTQDNCTAKWSTF